MPKLTIRSIQAIKPTDRETIVWDSELRGFGVRAKPSGVKSFFIQYRNAHGQSRRFTVGRVGVLAPEEARKRAKKLLADVSNGADPAGKRAEMRAAPTIAELAERYIEEHALVRKKSSSVTSDRKLLRLHVLPRLGRLKVDAVARRDIANLMSAMKATPGAANRTYALISKMMNLAEKWDLRPDGSNPCRHVEKYPERKLERFLSTAELARLGAVLAEAERDRTEMPSVVAAIRLLVFTGARVDEILSLHWDQVDFENRLLRLDDSKTGARPIMLNAPALEVLATIERDPNSPWVIAGRIEGNRLVNIRKPWHRIRKRAGLDDVRLHDLRHSFASVAAASGLSLPIIGGLLGHSQPATTARYAHLANDPLHQANDLIGSRIAAAMSATSATVEAIRGKR